jgi:hypothetical protein
MIEVYYQKEMDTKWFLATDKRIGISRANFHEKWKKMPVEFKAGTHREKIFEILNLDNNPIGTPEGQAWLRRNGVRHTSMSVGDIVKKGGKYFMVLGEGWATVDLI